MAALRALLADANDTDNTTNGAELDLITKLRAIVNTGQGGGGTSGRAPPADLVELPPGDTSNGTGATGEGTTPTTDLGAGDTTTRERCT